MEKSISFATTRTVERRRAWAAKSPCEKLKRKTPTPPRINRFTISGESLAGPIVATMLVRIEGAARSLAEGGVLMA
jgi:hypothetical protein